MGFTHNNIHKTSYWPSDIKCIITDNYINFSNSVVVERNTMKSLMFLDGYNIYNTIE